MNVNYVFHNAPHNFRSTCTVVLHSCWKCLLQCFLTGQDFVRRSVNFLGWCVVRWLRMLLVFLVLYSSLVLQCLHIVHCQSATFSWAVLFWHRVTKRFLYIWFKSCGGWHNVIFRVVFIHVCWSLFFTVWHAGFVCGKHATAVAVTMSCKESWSVKSTMISS